MISEIAAYTPKYLKALYLSQDSFDHSPCAPAMISTRWEMRMGRSWNLDVRWDRKYRSKWRSKYLLLCCRRSNRRLLLSPVMHQPNWFFKIYCGWKAHLTILSARFPIHCYSYLTQSNVHLRLSSVVWCQMFCDHRYPLFFITFDIIPQLFVFYIKGQRLFDN